MPDVAAALLVVAGAIFVYAGTSSSTLTDASKLRLVGFGSLLAGVGLVASVFAIGINLYRLIRVM